MSDQPAIRVTNEVELDRFELVRTAAAVKWDENQPKWPTGYYIVEEDESGIVVHEGPIPDEAYARHRAQTVHGMERATPEEIAEDWLPW